MYLSSFIVLNEDCEIELQQGDGSETGVFVIAPILRSGREREWHLNEARMIIRMYIM